MAMSAGEFGQRLDEKPLAAPGDYERYRRIDDNFAYIQVRDRLVPVLPRTADLFLTNEELLVADARAPFWRDGEPELRALEPSFSLKPQQTRVRDQLDRNTCVSFASLAALEHFLRLDDIDANLSEQYANWLFMKREGRPDQCYEWLHTKRAAGYLSSHGVCRESEWGYKDSATVRCRIGPPKEALQAATFGIGDYRLIGGGLRGPRMGNTDYLESILSQGKTIVTAIGLAIGAQRACNEAYDVLNEWRGVPRVSEGGHAMLLVGYDRDCRHFELKNSWGTSDEDDGYVRLAYDYVIQYARYGFVVMGIDDDKPIDPELDSQDLHFVRMRLGELERRSYRQPPASKVLIHLPSIERNESTAGIVFKVRKVGEGLDQLEDGLVSTERFVLPAAIEAKVGQGGVGHLIFTASDEEGKDIPGVRPLVVTVNVGNQQSEAVE